MMTIDLKLIVDGLQQWVEVEGVAVPEEEVRQVEAPGGEAPFLLSA